jgi:hypothetical protein
MRKFCLLASLLLQACASSQIRPLRPNELPTGPYHESGSQTFVGTLMYEGNCLLFEDEDKSMRVLPVWPHGSTFEESLITFHQPGKLEQRVMVGQEIELKGEKSDWAAVADSHLAPFEHQCGSEPFFVSGMTPAN